MSDKLKKSLAAPAKTLFAILIALLIGVLLVLPTGTSPLEAYKELWNGAFGSKINLLNTLARSTPLLFTGLAAALAFRSGVFNIGIEGQLYIGAFSAALVGIYGQNLPSLLLIPLCMLAAVLGGLLWAVIPGLLNTKYQINLVVICTMMNSIAELLTDYLCSYPFKGDIPTSATVKLGENAWLARFNERSEFNIGFIFAVLCAVILYLLMFKTRFGYESRALGINRRFTSYIGVNVNKKILAVLFISGMVAGLAGAEQVMGVNHRFISEFSSDYGFTGITVALLGGLNPLGVVIGALFFGALENGAIQMEVMTNISRDLISSLQAVIIMLLAAEELIKGRKQVRKLKKPNGPKAPANSGKKEVPAT